MLHFAPARRPTTTEGAPADIKMGSEVEVAVELAADNADRCRRLGKA
jgi:hypothetical protein